jgi:malonate transporter and related proteins
MALGVVLPVFGVILLGVLTGRRRLIDAAGMRGLNDFVFFVALPALLFDSVAAACPSPVFDVAAVCFGGCLAVYALAMLLGRFLLRADFATAAMLAFNATFGNTVLMGIPIVRAAFGPPAIVYLLAIIAFHSVLLLPLAAVLVELCGHRRGGLATVLAAMLSGLRRNPVILAIVAALLWRLEGLGLPGPAPRLLGMLADAAPALALFCLGA